MSKSICRMSLLSIVFSLCLGTLSPVQAQSAIQMEILRERVQSDKKALIEANLDLTAAEANAFWPVYDEFQIEIEALNSRIGWVIRDFGEAYVAGSITEEQAEDLLDEVIAIDEDDAKMRKKYAKQFQRILAPATVVRYLQIENKIRAAIRFDLAANIVLFE